MMNIHAMQSRIPAHDGTDAAIDRVALA